MRRLLWLARLAVLFLISATSLPSTAQQFRRLEVFGEYSHLQFDSQSFGFANNTSMNGWNAGAQFKLIPEFGIVGEVGGQYGSHLHSYQAMIGPQVSYQRHSLTGFAHLLFGQAQNRVSIVMPGTEKSRAVAFGGGVDYDLSPRLAIRIIEADYLHTHTFGASQSNIKLSAGIVFRFDRFMGTQHKEKPPQAP